MPAAALLPIAEAPAIVNLHGWVANGAVTTLGYLLRTTIDVMAVAVLVMICQLLFRRWLTPAWRFRLWALVVVRLLLPAVPASPTSVWNLTATEDIEPWLHAGASDVSTEPLARTATHAERVLAQHTDSLPYEFPPSGVTSYAADPLADDGPSIPGFVSPSAIPQQVYQHAAPAPPHVPVLPLILLIVWALGVLLLMARLIAANLVFKRRLRASCAVDDPAIVALLAACCREMRLARAPPLLITDAVYSPATTGVWRPIILIPPSLFATLSTTELRVVLLHELAHIRCRDVAVNWLLGLLQAVHWFNPFVWLAFARMRADREVARDATVLAVIAPKVSTAGSSAAATEYARTLLIIAERLSAVATAARVHTRVAARPLTAGILGDGVLPLAAGVLGRRPHLHRRLHMITRYTTPTRHMAFLGTALFTALGCGTLTGRQIEQSPSTGAQSAKPVDAGESKPATQATEMLETLVAESRRLVATRQYAAALATVDRILFRDPHHAYATGIRPLLQDQLALQQVRDSRDRRSLADEAVPDAVEPTPEDRVVQAQLDRKLPEVKFQDVGFADAIDFMRDLTGANIFVNWKAVEGADIDRNTPVSARLVNIKASKALTIILDAVSKPKARLDFVIDNGVISISLAEDLSKNVLTRVYDVRDLLSDAANEPREAKGAEGLAATKPATQPSTMPAEAMASLLSKMIIETVAPNTWRDAGGSIGAIRYLSGQLIVTQTPENHRSLVVLLVQVRKVRSVQVMVDAQFISADPARVKDLQAQWQKQAVGIATTQPAGGMNEGSAGDVRVFPTESHVAEFLQLTEDPAVGMILASPRLMLFSSRSSAILLSDSQSYIRDYATVKGPDGAIRYEPIPGKVEAGVTLDIQATVSADRQFVTLSLRPKVTALGGFEKTPWPERPAESNLTIQKPKVRTSEIKTVVSLRDGGTVMLAGMDNPGIPAAPSGNFSSRPTPRPDHRLYVLVKTHIVVPRSSKLDLSTLPSTRPE